MRVKVKGLSHSLTQSDFVAKGGQGSVYVKGDTAFKIYHKAGDMLPEAKMGELSKITDPRVIRPVDVVMNAKNAPVGYTMRFVDDTYALCQVFPKVFKERNGIKQDTLLKLVLMLRESVLHVHSCDVHIIDLNELNLLVAKTFSEIFLIDADSYQTRSYRATYIMPSVRDWSVEPADFGEGSDWFSFAIVTFQLFIGIHPYKGRHPDIKGMEDRMKANVSVFDKNVSVPKVCYPLDSLPDAYRRWYEGVFVKGERGTPPADAHALAAVSVPIKMTVVSKVLVVDEVRAFPGLIVQVFGDGEIALIDGAGVFVGNTKTWEVPTGQVAIGLSHTKKVPCLVDHEGNVTAVPGRGLKCSTPIQGITDMMEYEGRVYVKTAARVSEIKLSDTGSKLVPMSNFTATTMRHATSLYPGVVIESMLGSIFVSVFPLEKASYQTRIKELEEYKIVNAKYDRGVLVVIAAKGGQYDRLVFRFNGSFTEYDVRVVSDVGIASINFVTLTSGVCVLLNEEEKLEVFSFQMGAKSLKVIEDAALDGDMHLVRLGSGIGFYRGNQLFSMKMKGGSQ